MSFTIGKRIVVGFAAVLGLTAALGGFSYWSLSQIAEHSSSVSEDSLPGLEASSEISSGARKNYIRLLRHVNAVDPAEQADLEREMVKMRESVTASFDRYEAAITTEEDRKLFERVKIARPAYLKTNDAVLELSRAGKNEEARKVVDKDLYPVYKAYMEATDAVEKYNGDRLKHSAANSLTTAQSTKTVTVVAVLASLLVGVGTSFWIIRKINQALTQVSKSLGDSSSQVASASTQVSSSSQSLAQGASEQAASLEETSSAINEMASMIKKNAESGIQANALSEEAKRASGAGTEAMTRMNTAILDIERSSQDTAKIIKTIDEIAFQTNLLALNAAVEAARAGEAGKGFAVVAEEVRNLAMRSAEAAKNTSSLIEESVGKAKNGVTIAQTVATNLTQINDAATRVSALIAEIAAAGREQATGIDQISQAVGQMDKVTQTNAANAEETAAASEELNAQAEQLQGCVRDLQALVGLEQSAQHRAAPPARLRQHVNTNSHSVSKASAPKSTGRELIPLESAQETRSDFSEFSKAA